MDVGESGVGSQESVVGSKRYSLWHLLNGFICFFIEWLNSDDNE